MTTRRVSRGDAAALLKVSMATVDRRISRGELETEEYYEGRHKRVWVLVPEDQAEGPEDDIADNDLLTQLRTRVTALEGELMARDAVEVLLRERLVEADGNVQQLLKQLDVSQKHADDLSNRMLPPDRNERRSRWLFWRRSG